MKNKGDDTAISEIIGTILMLGMAIALFTAVSLIITSYPLSTPSPQVDLVGFIDGSNIIFEHHGGPSLLSDTRLGITINGSTTIILVGSYIEDNNNNNRWDIGEQVIYTTSGINQAQVDVMVIDYASNSVLMMATIQDIGNNGTTTPSILTKINPVIPYLLTATPALITAKGSAELDSVTLYHRWSTDNWTIPWVTLTYDDFENGFGNYTDGGDDCSLYTGDTFAHQGNNAVNIQDDAGDDSSFFHTSGIDVDTSGYSSIKIDFWFYADSMEPGRDFWVQYFDGSSWVTVADYDSGDDFVNEQFYHEIIWINESSYTFPTDMQVKFICDAQNNNDDVYIDQIYVNATEGSPTNWLIWNDTSNPDLISPWSWNLDFPYGTGFYEFYSIGSIDGNDESPPIIADSRCYYNP